jgi:hypothetical protein
MWSRMSLNYMLSKTVYSLYGFEDGF